MATINNVLNLLNSLYLITLLKPNFKDMKKIVLSITLIVAAVALSACTEETPEARRAKKMEICRLLPPLGSNQFFSMSTEGCTIKELEQIGKAFEDGYMYTNEIDHDLFVKLLQINPNNVTYFTSH